MNRLTRYQRLALTVTLAATLSSLVSPERVQGCGVCIDPGAGLKRVHPKSLSVAVAIRKALDTGLLKSAGPKATLPRQQQLLDLRLGRALAADASLPDKLELLLVEDGARYRLVRRGQTAGFVHVPPSAALPPGSTRWVTGRAVLFAVSRNQLQEGRATQRGLIVIETTPQMAPKSAERNGREKTVAQSDTKKDAPDQGPPD